MTLWAHQQKAVEAARTQRYRNMGILFDVGTGKTATLITILRECYNRERVIKPTLIFAPLSVCPQWKHEFAAFAPKIPPDRIAVLNRAGKKRLNEFERAFAKYGRNFILVTNYEAVRTEPFLKKLQQFAPEIAVADEVHRLKNPGGKQAARIYPLSDGAERCFGLTGTLILNNLMDVFGQMRFIDPSLFGTKFWSFRNKYFYDANSGMPSRVHFPNMQPREFTVDELAEKISRVTVQASRHECLDLPPLNDVPVRVELSREQRRLYKMMEREFIAELDGHVVTAEFAMTKSLRLQQMLCGYVQEDETKEVFWMKENPRVQALEEKLIALQGAKAIVWTVFRPTYGMIADACTKLKIKSAFLTGEQNAQQKQESVDSFRNGDTQILIANAGAGGEGINLTEAPYAIYFQKNFHSGHLRQSQARNYRAGSEQHEKIIHFHLEAEDTIDQAVSQALINKQSVSDAVMEWAKGNR